MDGFGVPEIIGKVGTDIQDNKCSWLINEALKRASPKQRKAIEDNYGKKDLSAETKVKEVYNEMDLEMVYRKYEDEKVGQIKEAIYSIDETEGLKKSIFEGFLNKIHKRTKQMEPSSDGMQYDSKFELRLDFGLLGEPMPRILTRDTVRICRALAR